MEGKNKNQHGKPQVFTDTNETNRKRFKNTSKEEDIKGGEE